MRAQHALRLLITNEKNNHNAALKSFLFIYIIYNAQTSSLYAFSYKELHIAWMINDALKIIDILFRLYMFLRDITLST